MLVTHKDDFITHAVITKSETKQFTMANTPEFFHVLSTSLYKYQSLAMVRETLCNAWDAHIEAGLQDTPIEVNFDEDNNLVIRDFGSGIPDEKMHEIYCVYGLSTKAKNENVTGGFGLGCKAPFAYTDTFEVTSWNQGTMTVYNLSKSAGEVEGIPGCTPIVSVPTTESGLRVRIRIKNSDRGNLETLIKQIVLGGGILCKFNGIILPRLALNTTPGSWALTSLPICPIDGHRSQVLYLRYGNVIYQVGLDGNDHPAYRQLIEFLGNVRSNLERATHNRAVQLVLQAVPGTLSVNPSRESLNMTPQTLKAINDLCDLTLKGIFSKLSPMAFPVVKKIVDEAIERRDYHTLLTELDGPPTSWGSRTYNSYNSNRGPKQPLPPQHTYNTLDNLIEHLVLSHTYYGRVAGLREYDLDYRFKRMLEVKLLDEGAIRSLRKAVRIHYSKRKGKPPHNALEAWFKHTIVKRVLGFLSKHPLLDPKQLWVATAQHGSVMLKSPATYDYIRTTSHESAFNFARKLVVLSYTKEIAQLNVDNSRIPGLTEAGSLRNGALVYVVSRKEGAREAALWYFEKHGYVVIDLTITREWITLPVKYEKIPHKPITVKPRGPKRSGVVSLSSCVISEHSEVVLAPYTRVYEKAVRLLKPEAVVAFERQSYGDRLFHLPYLDAKTSVLAAKVFGNRIGLVRSHDLLKPFLDKGIPDGSRFVVDEVLRELDENENIKNHLGSLLTHSKLPGEYHYQDELIKFMKLVQDYPPAAKFFKLPRPLSIYEKQILQLWEYLKGHRGLHRVHDVNLGQCKVTAREKLISNIPINDAFLKAATFILDRKIHKMIDVNVFKRFLGPNAVNTQDPKDIKLTHDLFMRLLKG